MSQQVIYVKDEGYNGLGDSDGGDFLATCVCVAFAIFLIIIW